ncbi:MAG: GNAT family N-acetyltransferase [Hamadaea sp.]|nr:GNAT family N-acetyltransferase [Hamadaea sp.]NUT05182.1 GNAT family N-acetyltransferase [Hamadaea sp.]
MITGELIRLRAFEPEEADALWRWNHDPAVMRWMDQYYVNSLDRARRGLADAQVNSFAHVLYAVEVLADGKLIGLVQLRDTDAAVGSAELDIYLGEKDYWGRGYATDAMRTICRYGFDTMRLHRIGLTVVEANEAARRVYAKVGFVEEGRLRDAFRRDGRWYDKIAMGLLEGELS